MASDKSKPLDWAGHAVLGQGAQEVLDAMAFTPPNTITDSEGRIYYDHAEVAELKAKLQAAPAPERSGALSEFTPSATGAQTWSFLEPERSGEAYSAHDEYCDSMGSPMHEAPVCQCGSEAHDCELHGPKAQVRLYQTEPTPPAPCGGKTSSELVSELIIKDPDRTFVVADDKGTVLPLRVWALKTSPSLDAVLLEMRDVMHSIACSDGYWRAAVTKWESELAAAVGEVKP